MSPPLKIGFLASCNGSSAQAIVDAVAAGGLDAEVRLMVSNNKSAPALNWARAKGVPTLCVPTASDPDAADARLAAEMAEHGVELVVLSGYLRRLGPQVLARYGGRILNVHPGPLPQFGGQGMYGRRVHEAVVTAGAKESAICIHVVDEEYDHGPAVARRAVPVEPGDTPEALEARVKTLEPAFFVETLKKLTRGELTLPGHS